MTPTSRRVCYNCLYFKPFANKEDIAAARGECRRLAPRPSQSAIVSLASSSWPIVKGLDWCGQWRSYHERPGGWPIKGHQ